MEGKEEEDNKMVSFYGDDDAALADGIFLDVEHGVHVQLLQQYSF
jgi:hypothetical protein